MWPKIGTAAPEGKHVRGERKTKNTRKRKRNEMYAAAVMEPEWPEGDRETGAKEQGSDVVNNKSPSGIRWAKKCMKGKEGSVNGTTSAELRKGLGEISKKLNRPRKKTS